MDEAAQGGATATAAAIEREAEKVRAETAALNEAAAKEEQEDREVRRSLQRTRLDAIANLDRVLRKYGERARKLNGFEKLEKIVREIDELLER